MKRISFYATVIMLIASTSFVMAGPRGMGGMGLKGMGGMQMMGSMGKMGMDFGDGGLNSFILTKFGLSDEQIESITALKEAFETDSESVQTQLDEKKEALRALWMEATLDAEAIKTMSWEIHDLKGQLMDKRIDLRLAIRNVLTADQVAQLIELRDQFDLFSQMGRGQMNRGNRN